MDDKTLADAVVALGADQCGNEYRWLDAGVVDAYPAPKFVRDWRVCGALMEKVLDGAKDRKAAWKSVDPQGAWISLTKPANLPRTIIEKCVEALNG